MSLEQQINSKIKWYKLKFNKAEYSIELTLIDEILHDLYELQAIITKNKDNVQMKFFSKNPRWKICTECNSRTYDSKYNKTCESCWEKSFQ